MAVASAPRTGPAACADYGSTPDSPKVVNAGVGTHNELFSTVAPLSYLILYCVYDILAAHTAKENGGFYAFEPTCLVLVVEMSKLAVTLFLLFAFGTQDWPDRARLTYTAFGLAGPALCFTAINILTLVCLAGVSLAHYAVWYQIGIFFNAVLYWVAFRRPFGGQRIVAIVILFVGCTLNVVEDKMVITLQPMIALVVFCAFISSVGCVLNEYFFKKDAALDINLQNTILYTETSFCCIILLAFAHTKRLSSIEHFFEGFSLQCWMLIVVQVFIGLSVSRILKYASVITKNYVMALHVPIEVVLAHYIIGTYLGHFTIVSTIFICVSTWLYYSAPPMLTPAEQAALAEKTALAEKIEAP